MPRYVYEPKKPTCSLLSPMPEHGHGDDYHHFETVEVERCAAGCCRVYECVACGWRNYWTGRRDQKNCLQRYHEFYGTELLDKATVRRLRALDRAFAIAVAKDD